MFEDIVVPNRDAMPEGQASQIETMWGYVVSTMLSCYTYSFMEGSKYSRRIGANVYRNIVDTRLLIDGCWRHTGYALTNYFDYGKYSSIFCVDGEVYHVNMKTTVNPRHQAGKFFGDIHYVTTVENVDEIDGGFATKVLAMSTSNHTFAQMVNMNNQYAAMVNLDLTGGTVSCVPFRKKLSGQTIRKEKRVFVRGFESFIAFVRDSNDLHINTLHLSSYPRPSEVIGTDLPCHRNFVAVDERVISRSSRLYIPLCLYGSNSMTCSHLLCKMANTQNIVREHRYNDSTMHDDVLYFCIPNVGMYGWDGRCGSDIVPIYRHSADQHNGYIQTLEGGTFLVGDGFHDSDTYIKSANISIGDIRFPTSLYSLGDIDLPNFVGSVKFAWRTNTV